MLEPQKEEIKGIEFWMQPVEGGKFWMGSHDDNTDAFGDEKPRHEVQVSTFFIGKYPVTQSLWQAVAQAAPEFGLDKNPSRFAGDDRPVEQVSWEDITQKFLPALEKLTGKKYRLPTEAEWEYAARGGKHANSLSKGKGRGEADFKYAGSDRLKDVGWFDENSGGMTRPVGLKQPNQLGIYDLSGNVWEWCEDAWDENFYQKCAEKGVVENPCVAGRKGSRRVLRGGGWLGGARSCRAACRYYYAPGLRWAGYGFRLALSLQSDG